MPPRIIRANNLGFPFGVAPGVDFDHVALGGGGTIRYSSVNIGGTGHVNLLNGRAPDSTSGTLSSSIIFNAPYAVFANTTLQSFTTGINFATDLGGMIACIFYTTSTAADQRPFAFGNTVSANGVGITLLTSGTVIDLRWGATITSTTLTFAANTPYFLVVGRSGTGTNQAFGLIQNLLTGKIVTSTFTHSAANVTPTAVHIGETATGLIGGVAAAAFIGGGFPSLQMAQEWAADPWAFWYPQNKQFSFPGMRITVGRIKYPLPSSASAPPMAFPFGAVPGLDPTHVALSNGGTCRFSGAVVSNGGHVNILTGKQPNAFLGTVAPSFNFGIPWYRFSNSVATRESFTSGVNLATDTPFMMGVIAYALVTSTSQAIFFFGSTTTGYSVSFTSSGIINPQVGTGNAGATAPAYSANVPYFICWGRQGTGTNQAFMLVVRLDTGKVITAQTFTASGAATTPTGVLIGQTTVGGGGGVAAAAYIGGGFPTLQIAEAWAQDPWSFWYQRRQYIYGSVGASAVVITAFTINIGAGTYTLQDNNNTLIKTSIDNLQMAGFTLTDEQLSLAKGSRATIQTGTYILTGENVTEVKKSLLNTQFTNFALTPENLTELKTSRTTIFTVNYTLTDEQLQLLKGSLSKAFAGFYNLTGENVTELKTSKAFIQTGTYVLVGETLVLKKGSLVNIQETPFALTVENETLLRAAHDNPQTGFYTLTDENIVLKKTSTQTIQTVFYTLTGESITLSIPGNFTMSIGAGVYTLTGNNVTLLKTSTDHVQTATFALTDEQLTLLKASKDFVQTGFYNLTDENLTLKAARLDKVQTGFYNLTGENETLLATHRDNIQAGTYALTGENEVLKWAHLDTVQTGFYNLTVESLSLSIPGAFFMNLSAGTYALTGENVVEVKASKLLAQFTNFSFLVQSEQTLRGAKSNIYSGSYAFTIENEQLRRGAQAAIQAGTYTLNGEQIKEIVAHLSHLQAGFYAVTIESLTLTNLGFLAIITASPVLTGQDQSPTLLGQDQTPSVLAQDQTPILDGKVG